MELNDLLRAGNINPEQTLVLRHVPREARFREVVNLVAGERPDLFTMYQSYQSEAVERSMLNLVGGWLVSFVRYSPGRAIFVGVYTINGHTIEDADGYRSHPENVELSRLGVDDFLPTDDRPTVRHFDLRPIPHLGDWNGKLVIGWPPPERSWYRRAHQNIMPILAIREESFFAGAMKTWDEVDFTWAELALLPTRWRAALEQWRGVYLIWDSSDGRSYVGSAYGSTNILGRWSSYAATGHGGNKLLRARDPRNFRFTILQRVSPDLDDAEVIRLENTWKARLHSRAPHGLNEN